MIHNIPIILTASDCRLRAALPDVCPTPSPSNRSALSYFICRSIFLPSTSQTALSAALPTDLNSPNCHSKRRSFSDTASFK
jgi:hypothetical protein